MTDYAGEQAMELEALEAILMDDMEEYEGMLPPDWTTHGQTYKVRIRPTDDGMGGDEDGGGDEDIALELLFAHTPTYPDEPPCLKPRSIRGLGDAEVRDLAAALGAVASENLGMAMVYQLVTAAQEWLAARLQQRAGPDPEADRKRAEEEEEARHAAMRAHGHPVTAESFAAWKKKFEAEAAAARAAGGGGGGDGKGGGGGGGEQRLTGKAWFVKQAAAGVVVSGSEEEEEEGFDEGEEEEGAASGAGGLGEDEEEEEDFDFEEGDTDEDDDEMLEQYLSSKAAK